MIAAGPRDVLVPASGVEAARALLAADSPAPVSAGDERNRFAFKLAAGLLAGLLSFGAVAGAIYALIR